MTVDSGERASAGRGGVSAKPREPALRGGGEVQGENAPQGPPGAAAVNDFTYHGGPIVSFPLMYTSFWGSLWLSDPAHTERAGFLAQFNQEILQTNFMNVVSQYGVGSGAGSGCFIQSSFLSNVPNTLTDQEPGTDSVVNVLQGAINAGVVPEPNPNQCVVIYLDDNTAINDPTVGLVLCEPAGDTAFGYHNFFTTQAGNLCFYAIVPSLTDPCLTESCPDDNFCSLHLAESQFDRLTQVTSHELAEMWSDPRLDAWFSPTRGECGDICNGETAFIQAPDGTVWAVQPQYSLHDDTNTNGQVFCVAENPSPEARLSGPASTQGLLARARRAGDTTRMLPLPAVQLDVKAGTMTLDQQAFQSYLKKAFSPVQPRHVIGNLGQFLRQAADMADAQSAPSTARHGVSAKPR